MTGIPPLVDIHNHLIPGVDDGARRPEEALAALEAMRAQGVGRLIATPHLDAGVTGRSDAFADRMAAVDAGWATLREIAREVPEVEIARGHEIMLDMPDVTLDDPRVRLAGGSCVLVEFPRLQVPPGSASALYRIRGEGYLPIVAHPERYVNVDVERLDLVDEWRRMGARIVVNAGSLLGGFGPGARATTLAMLQEGWVDVVGSDYHARPGRPLLLAKAYEQLAEWGGEDQARLLLSVNPGRVMDGEEPLAVPPLELRRWRRLRALFRK